MALQGHSLSSLDGRNSQGIYMATEQANIMPFIKKEDLGNSKSHFNPWEGHGANHRVSCI